jgi:hypothetical protein
VSDVGNAGDMRGPYPDRELLRVCDCPRVMQAPAPEFTHRFSIDAGFEVGARKDDVYFSPRDNNSMDDRVWLLSKPVRI